MLVELRVVDLGLIDEMTVVFGPGLSAVTGETGAGKTLVVEALGLLAGGRADPALVRAEASEAVVEGRFVSADGSEHVLARAVPMEGRSRAYIDGRLATATELASLAAELIEIHGQHAALGLLAPAAQRAALDAFAGDAARDARDRYRAARAGARAAGAQLAALGGDARARAREIGFLSHELAEIDAAGITDPDEDVALAGREELLAGAEAHRDALLAAYRLMSGPVPDALGEAGTALAGSAALSAHADRLRSLQAEAEDAARDLRLAAEAVDVAPESLAAVQARRRTLSGLRRKYGDSLGEVCDYAAGARARFEDLERYEERAQAWEDERSRAAARADAAAFELRACRRAAAGALAAAVGERLGRLGLGRAEVAVDVAEDEPGEDGADRVVFLLAANPGEPLRPWARAASGGELSRAVLALHTALSDAGASEPGGPPTLVFDEVDAGIGGEAGIAVGRELAALGAERQVLCATHLAQVAAFADAQVAVRKQEEEGRTVTRATVVDGEARVAELSRMLAGVAESRHARRHAAELLAEAGGPR